jgi:uncharacterized protein YjbJ (UPF0337 family)
MNKDQIKGKAKDIGGKIQEKSAKSPAAASSSLKGCRTRPKAKSRKKWAM